MSRTRNARTLLISGLAAAAAALAPATAHSRVFEAGSLIIPMDLAYQDTGILQAYGLVFQLLRQGVEVHWIIEPTKTWHAASCDTDGDECAWDCWEEGSGVKCSYPTTSPDFFAGANVIWDGDNTTWQPGSTTSDAVIEHGYRGGPFMIDADDATAALAIIDLWNDSSQWPDESQCAPNPEPWAADCWARRSVFNVVTVHQTTAELSVNVSKLMVAAPTIAVFSDGNENIATSYLRAAGIPQSNGNEFPVAKCSGLAEGCGPGTVNPDMLTVQAVMGDMGTCSDPIMDHKNGALFTSDGVPAYCQIMSMHWDVNDRETVTCDGDDNLVYHGHEVVAEVRQFLNYPTHFFAECQAVNAYENAVSNPGPPHYDDPDPLGHFLTTTGTPPDCTDNCAGADFDAECVTNGCDNGTRDCCLPRNNKELGAGFLIGEQPDTVDVQILSPEIPYNQMDGWFGTTGGSEKSYNLSTYLDTRYHNDLDITFVTGPSGPGQDDIWMTGYLDGTCDIRDEGGNCQGVGKVSYLGGHAYKTDVPLSGEWQTQGCRMFLNALFEADCVTTVAAPSVTVSLTGDQTVAAPAVPAESTYTIDYQNSGMGAALDGRLILVLPDGVSVTEYEAVGGLSGSELEWDLGTIGTEYGMPGDPPATGSRWATLSFAAPGEYTIEAQIEYRVGVNVVQAAPWEFTVTVAFDSDGDTIPDDLDPAPDDASQCGDADGDDCDDCTVAATSAPDNDGPDADGDGLCDTGDADDDGDGIDDADDPFPADPNACGDSDGDTCDDCTTAGTFAPEDDGPDADGDGLCDAGDSDSGGIAGNGGAGGSGETEDSGGSAGSSDSGGGTSRGGTSMGGADAGSAGDGTATTGGTSSSDGGSEQGGDSAAEDGAGEQSGCGCSVPGQASSQPTGLWALAGIAVAIRRRRARSRC